jgi:hypothetical protein
MRLKCNGRTPSVFALGILTGWERGRSARLTLLLDSNRSRMAADAAIY